MDLSFKADPIAVRTEGFNQSNGGRRGQRLSLEIASPPPPDSFARNRRITLKCGALQKNAHTPNYRTALRISRALKTLRHMQNSFQYPFNVCKCVFVCAPAISLTQPVSTDKKKLPLNV